jgi:hypothetical protein
MAVSGVTKGICFSEISIFSFSFPPSSLPSRLSFSIFYLLLLLFSFLLFFSFFSGSLKDSAITRGGGGLGDVGE